MDTGKYLKKIDSLSKRHDSGRFEYLTEDQKALYECLKDLFAKTEEQELQRKFIKEQCKPKANTEARGTFISDFCYNLINLQDDENKFLIRSEGGLYRFVDFGWFSDEAIDVTWTLRGKDVPGSLRDRPLKVGTYQKRSFKWDFELLRRGLELA